MPLQISVFSIVYLAMGAIALLLAAYSWRRRSVAGTWYFTFLMLAAAEWSITLALEMMVTEMPLKIFFGKWQYLGIVSCAPLWFLFVAGYTRNDGWMREWNAFLLWVVPVVTLGLVATNEIHGLVWPEIVPSIVDGTLLLVYANGPAALVSAAYSYILIIAASILLVFTVVQCSQIYRRQIWVLFACTIIVMLADFIDIAGWNPMPGVDLDPLAIGIAGILIFEGAIRFRLFDLAPVVYHSLYSAVHIGVIAIDNDGRIIECNPAARHYLSLPDDVIELPIVKAVPAVAAILTGAADDPGRHHEFSLGDREDKKWFEARLSPLPDYTGQPYGILVIFHDISRCKKTQEELQETHNKLGILSSVTRHDILNNLMAMEAFQELCRERIADPVTLGYIRKLQESSAMIRSQIEFMRNYEDTGGKAPSWYELRKTILEAAAAPPFRQVSMELEGPDADIYADPLIGKVFYNLIDNALSHGGHVTECIVTVRETVDGLLIVFSDNGCGIPASDKEKIFLQGFGNHTGLDLFLIKRILSMTDISICETGTEGAGAQFEILVPKGKFRIRPDLKEGTNRLW